MFNINGQQIEPREKYRNKILYEKLYYYYYYYSNLQVLYKYIHIYICISYAIKLCIKNFAIAILILFLVKEFNKIRFLGIDLSSFLS